ncbi:MAG: glutamate--cysteine ligase [Thermoleophilia bacterium]|nr:glutamate--cysteine ligase [Thermoleophilia bacterium]
MVALTSSTTPGGKVEGTRTKPRRVRGYGQSSAYSLGVEEEFQLLDPATMELTPVVDGLLATLDEADLASVKHELMQSVVETATTVCTGVEEAVADLARLRTLVIEAADRVGAVVASAGTTPVSRWEGQAITDKPRYRDIVARLQWVARRELIFGLHVHVGLDCADKTMYVFNALRTELPLLLALSANSPFWQGSTTGLQSSRIKVFDAFPRSGMPPALDGGWDEWEALLARGARSGLIPDHTYVWWDVRPHPDFGTIEVRICDAQTRLRDTAGLAALVQALVAWHGERFDAGQRVVENVPQLLIEENRWSAARYGLDGEMVDFTTDTLVPTRQLLIQLLDRTEPVARRLGSSEWFDGIAGMLDRTGASRQLDAWLAGGKQTRATAEQLVRDTAAFG